MRILGGEAGAETRPWTREVRAEKTLGKDEGKLAWTSESRREARGERRETRIDERECIICEPWPPTPLILAPQFGSVQPVQASHSSVQLSSAQLSQTQSRSLVAPLARRPKSNR